MKNLSIAFIAALSLMSFAGCKKKPGGGDSIAKMSEFKDQMCKCTDKKCAEGVAADMAKWSAEMQKAMGDNKEPVKMSDEDTKKSADINKAYGECMGKAMAAAMTPPATPPAGGDKPADPNAAAPPAGGGT